MSIQSLHKRLDKLPPPKPVDPQREIDRQYPIDIGVAKALRDDCLRLNFFTVNGGPHNAAEKNEESLIRKRNAETARQIGCPPTYRTMESERDWKRRSLLQIKRLTPNVFLTEAEVIEEALLTARIEAFGETPEGRARDRLSVLFLKKCSKGGLTASEYTERDRLRTLYPYEPELDPDDPMFPAVQKFRSMRLRPPVSADEPDDQVDE